MVLKEHSQLRVIWDLTMVAHWQILRDRLRMFVLQTYCGEQTWKVAPRHAGDAFYLIPVRFISRALDPAPASVCWDLAAFADIHLEVSEKLTVCRHAHGQLTNHDSANLLLLTLSLENVDTAATNPS